MAIKALSWMVRVFEPPVYCYHEIVHNRLVVERFEALGVIFVDDIASVPPNVPLMLSAHGSAPEVVEAARAQGRFVVNAVCPLVTKVHHEAKVRAGKGYTILYVGHAGHDEAVGTLAVAPESIHLVEHEADVDGLEPVYVTDEDEYFPPPRELRELIPALDRIAALALGGDPERARELAGAFARDRGVDASDALAGLSA
jgi:(E)-4-hydroxy-3-methyl-but-2-enyl pyrophosphate reductase